LKETNMKFASPILFGMLLVVVANTLHAGEPPPAEPGYRWVEVDGYEEIERLVCKVVPDVKKVKKIVYSTKDDAFCVPRPDLGGDSDTCPTCKGLYHRKILIKKEITCEEPTTKCVTAKVKVKVPCKVWQKIAIGTD